MRSDRLVAVEASVSLLPFRDAAAAAAAAAHRADSSV